MIDANYFRKLLLLESKSTLEGMLNVGWFV